MSVSEPEKKMKKALKDAGHTIADYIDPAPGEERDAEEILDEIICEIDSDQVGQAIAASDLNEGKPQPGKEALIRDLKANPDTEPFAQIMSGNDLAPGRRDNVLPFGKTGR